MDSEMTFSIWSMIYWEFLLIIQHKELFVVNSFLLGTIILITCSFIIIKYIQVPNIIHFFINRDRRIMSCWFRNILRFLIFFNKMFRFQLLQVENFVLYFKVVPWSWPSWKLFWTFVKDATLYLSQLFLLNFPLGNFLLHFLFSNVSMGKTKHNHIHSHLPEH